MKAAGKMSPMPVTAPRARIRPAPAARRTVAVLDGIVAVLTLVTLSTLLTGGFRAELLGMRVSTTSWWRLAGLAVLVLAARHAWRPSPSIVARAWDGLVAWRRDPVTRATWPIVITTRAGVLLLGLLAVYAIGYPGGRAPIRVAEGEVANLPARFDAGWYLGIATTGYDYTPNRLNRQQNVVFFPAFPALMGWVSLLLARQVVWSGAIVSILAFAWAMRYLFRLARELMDDERAVTAVALMAVYPFALFFSAPYTEGLFLLALVGAWWHMRRDERWAGFGWGFLAGLTRPNGCLLSVPLALMVVAPLWKHGRLQSPPGGWLSLSDRFLVAAAPGLGMLVYSAYVFDLTGDPFTWIRLQAAWGRENIGAASFLAGEWRSLGEQGLYGYATADVPNFLNASAGLLVGASLVPVLRRFGLPAAALLVVNLLPSIASGGWLSVGRATTVLFPVFLWLADAIPARHRGMWIGAFAALQAFAATLFFTWRQMF
ncbi:MAG: glycosyltransferase family 39 protein [Acidobacteria bacterium]|nr:glycosyltransferase family 39 protein [Acidobacteriota bacterium]